MAELITWYEFSGGVGAIPSGSTSPYFQTAAQWSALLGVPLPASDTLAALAASLAVGPLGAATSGLNLMGMQAGNLGPDPSQAFGLQTVNALAAAVASGQLGVAAAAELLVGLQEPALQAALPPGLLQIATSLTTTLVALTQPELLPAPQPITPPPVPAAVITPLPELLPYPWVSPAPSNALNPSTDLYPPASQFTLPPPSPPPPSPPPPGITPPNIQPPGITSLGTQPPPLPQPAITAPGVQFTPPPPLSFQQQMQILQAQFQALQAQAQLLLTPQPVAFPLGVQPPPLPAPNILPPGAEFAPNVPPPGVEFAPPNPFGLPFGFGIAAGLLGLIASPSLPPPPPPPVTLPG